MAADEDAGMEGQEEEVSEDEAEALFDVALQPPAAGEVEVRPAAAHFSVFFVHSFIHVVLSPSLFTMAEEGGGEDPGAAGGPTGVAAGVGARGAVPQVQGRS